MLIIYILLAILTDVFNSIIIVSLAEKRSWVVISNLSEIGEPIFDKVDASTICKLFGAVAAIVMVPF